MPILHIVRGLPGSGKTTFARKLAAETGAILIEPDALLVQDGEYRWSPVLYCMAVRAAKDMLIVATRMGCDVIYADVLPRRGDVQSVVAFINKMMTDIYTVTVHEMKISTKASMVRNIHNVRTEDIERMAREWEDWQ